MRVITPITITAATNTTIAEPDTTLAIPEATYNAGTTYALAALVISTTTHKKYESRQAANLGKPLPVPPETKTDWWIEVGATNKWAMFDLARNTQSVGNSPMSITFTPGERINSIGVLGMVADSVTITMTSSGAEVYRSTTTLTYRRVNDGYDYAFEPFGRRPSVVKFDLPPITNGIVTVLLTIAAGQVSCGSIIVGTFDYIGKAKFNAESDSINFSTITRDIYATATLVPRRTVPSTSQELVLEKARVDRVRDVRTNLNAVPALWSVFDDVNNDYAESLIILGIYKRFKINIANPNHAIVNLELEEI